jgi:hypothetical protein
MYWRRIRLPNELSVGPTYPAVTGRSTGQSMSKLRRRRAVSDAVLKEFFNEHLPYEIEMMRGLYDELSTGSSTWLMHNARIESFHIHARNLIEFFKNKRPCDFDPRLFTHGRYQPNGNFVDNRLEGKINQQISHLTADRTSDATKKLGPRDWAKIKGAVEKEIARWEEALSPEYKAKWKLSLV